MHLPNLARAAAAAALATIGVAGTAGACDVCAVYMATELRESRLGPTAGVFEQFSRFTSLRENGDEVPNPANERLESSITQLIVGYTFHPDWSAQLTLPVIHRSFRRVVEDGIERGSESGIGDLSLLAHYSPWSLVTERSVVRLSLTAGVKFPTGDADRLAEELHHDDEGDGDDGESHEEASSVHALSAVGQTVRAHAGEDHGDDESARSGVHGHDLAPGTGSFDGVFGVRGFASRDRLFFTANVQYLLRSEGDFDYRYADDLTWSAGPGLFLFADHRATLGIQGLITGETKGKDTLDGERLDDTAITAVYAGPGLQFTWGPALAGEIAADLPVAQNNSALQIVPDFRIRSGVTWRF